MRDDAKRAFKALLRNRGLSDDYKSRLNKLNISRQTYETFVESIFAMRRLSEGENDADWNKACEVWEQQVVLNKFSTRLENFRKKVDNPNEFRKTIAHIKTLQKMNLWSCPKGLTQFKKHNSPNIEALEKLNAILEEKPQETKDPLLDFIIDEPKNEPAVSPINDEFAVIDFSARNSPGRSDIDDYTIQLIYQEKTHRVVFNKYISNLVKNTSFLYVQLCQSTLTGETFFVFTRNIREGSILTRLYEYKKSSALHLNNKKLVEFLIKGRELKNGVCFRKVSKNLAKSNDLITIKLTD